MIFLRAFAIGILLVPFHHCLGQSFHVGLRSGFSVGLPDAQHSAYSTYRYSGAIGQVVEEMQSVNNSLGMGIPTELELGYRNKFGLSYGIAGGYLHGLAFEVTNKNIYYNSEDVYTRKFSGSYFHVTPTLGVAGRWRQIGILLTVGPMIAFPSYQRELNATVVNTSTRSDEIFSVTEYSGPATLGARATLDLEFFFKSNNKSIVLGLSYNHLSFSPTSAETTTYEVNRRDQIASLTTHERYSEFDSDQTIYYDVDEDGIIDWEQNAAEPYQGYRFDIPFDNLTLNIGFRFYFGKKRAEIEGKKPPL